MSKSELRAMVFDIQGYAVQDGPGVRTTIFLKGCPLRCLWCSNPESQRGNSDVLYIRTKCIRCHRCMDICQKGAISYQKELEREGFTTINHEICASCQDHVCVPECYQFALETTGTLMSVDEVMDRVIADASLLVQSGGGVTVSGGEPLISHEFVLELFKQCKEHYIHTAIETTGYASWDKFRTVLEYTDLALYDLKHMDPVVHKELTGVANELIRQNLEKVFAETKTQVIIRIPVIPGANDSNENMEATALYMKKIGAKQVDLMPYHRMGMGKYASLNRKYPLGVEVASLTKERILEIQRIFLDNNIICNLSGNN